MLRHEDCLENSQDAIILLRGQEPHNPVCKESHTVFGVH